MSANGAPFLSAPGFLDQRNIVLPVVAGIAAPEAAHMTGNHGILGNEIDPFRIDANTDYLAHQFAGAE